MDVIKKYENLVVKRSEISSLWHDVDTYCVPFKGKFFDGKDPYKLYDDTIFRAVNILVSGLYSYLTSPSSLWFKLSSPNIQVGSKWFGEATDVLHSLFRGSNFYKEVYGFYKDLVLYGVSAIYVEFGNNLVFRSISPKEFVFDKNIEGLVDFFASEMKIKAIDMVGMFGNKNLPDAVIKAIDNEPDKRFDVIFAVFENKDKKGKPYKSVWIEKETQQTLKEGGYDTFPFFVGFWDKYNGSHYSGSPTINALPSVILANRIVKTFWVNNEKLANPPLDIPFDGYAGDIDISPGAINYRTTTDPNDRIQPIVTSGDINITMESIQAVRESINERLFVDLFLMLQDRTMTATEVIQRTQEKLLLLGSVIGRLLHDVFVPLVNRSLYLAIANGVIDEPPDDNIKIEFLSPLAQSQKASEYQGIVMVLNTALQIAQVNPEIVDTINWDEMIRRVGKLYSVDERIFNSDDVVQQIRQQRAQMQQVQAQLQLEELKGKAMKQQTQAQFNQAKAQRMAYE